ncbi:hypothetical protein MAR_022550 [Mya arenaria]|uniref:Uncharacterized protein n=1 Tax=Mya arenaria TaxID=6604 RepID=A0ABY7DN72_MYAAR|nr:hypothetical protein MAR_022550 [Mya arenaria]
MSLRFVRYIAEKQLIFPFMCDDEHFTRGLLVGKIFAKCDGSFKTIGDGSLFHNFCIPCTVVNHTGSTTQLIVFLAKYFQSLSVNVTDVKLIDNPQQFGIVSV